MPFLKIMPFIYPFIKALSWLKIRKNLLQIMQGHPELKFDDRVAAHGL